MINSRGGVTTIDHSLHLFTIHLHLSTHLHTLSTCEQLISPYISILPFTEPSISLHIQSTHFSFPSFTFLFPYFSSSLIHSIQQTQQYPSRPTQCNFAGPSYLYYVTLTHYIQSRDLTASLSSQNETHTIKEPNTSSPLLTTSYIQHTKNHGYSL